MTGGESSSAGNLPAFSRLSRSPGTGLRILRFAQNDGQYNGTDYTNLIWTQGRRLSSLKKGNQTYSYEYDMSGVRSVKIVDGWKHEYVTQNGKVIRDKVTDASTGAFQYVLEFGYDESGRPLTLRWYYNEAETWYNAYYYICNAQGDVVKLVSDSGATIAAYSYDAWGALLSIQGESNGDAFIAYANPLRYRGYYYDSETGFYYLQSRYYDPIVKRFLNADSYASTGQGFLGYNMFAYCNNNPVNGFDPTGLFDTTCRTHTDGGTFDAYYQKTDKHIQAILKELAEHCFYSPYRANTFVTHINIVTKDSNGQDLTHEYTAKANHTLKIMGFWIFDAGISELSDTISGMLEKLPLAGYVVGQAFDALGGMANNLLGIEKNPFEPIEGNVYYSRIVHVSGYEMDVLTKTWRPYYETVTFIKVYNSLGDKYKWVCGE